MKRAVIQISGTQHLVAEGDKIFVNRLETKEGETFDIKEVLSVVDSADTKVGKPFVEGSKVEAKVLKPKKRYYKRLGHRQEISQIEIQKIV